MTQNMLLDVKNKTGQLLGLLTFDEQNQVQFIGDHDKNFTEFVKQTQEQGITQIRDIYDPDNKTFVMVEGPIEKSDPNYPSAFREFLGRQGYEVTVKHPEVEEEIKKLLEQFPDNNPDKVDILKRLPEMSYLEQTAILEGLKQIEKDEMA